MWDRYTGIKWRTGRVNFSVGNNQGKDDDGKVCWLFFLLLLCPFFIVAVVRWLKPKIIYQPTDIVLERGAPRWRLEVAVVVAPPVFDGVISAFARKVFSIDRKVLLKGDQVDGRLHFLCRLVLLCDSYIAIIRDGCQAIEKERICCVYLNEDLALPPTLYIFRKEGWLPTAWIRWI